LDSDGVDFNTRARAPIKRPRNGKKDNSYASVLHECERAEGGVLGVR